MHRIEVKIMRAHQKFSDLGVFFFQLTVTYRAGRDISRLTEMVRRVGSHCGSSARLADARWPCYSGGRTSNPSGLVSLLCNVFLIIV